MTLHPTPALRNTPALLLGRAGSPDLVCALSPIVDEFLGIKINVCLFSWSSTIHYFNGLQKQVNQVVLMNGLCCQSGHKCFSGIKCPLRLIFPCSVARLRVSTAGSWRGSDPGQTPSLLSPPQLQATWKQLVKCCLRCSHFWCLLEMVYFS